eukprot:GHVN01000558.1.p1 GENE.GHVN01000558.1~~GHVN01000558.1.p1  ORF type:complete len:206 (+),score=28.78 GHVN01000558.1:77-619(+)
MAAEFAKTLKAETSKVARPPQPTSVSMLPAVPKPKEDVFKGRKPKVIIHNHPPPAEDIEVPGGGEVLHVFNTDLQSPSRPHILTSQSPELSTHGKFQLLPKVESPQVEGATPRASESVIVIPTNLSPEGNVFNGENHNPTPDDLKAPTGEEVLNLINTHLQSAPVRKLRGSAKVPVIKLL